MPERRDPKNGVGDADAEYGGGTAVFCLLCQWVDFR